MNTKPEVLTRFRQKLESLAPITDDDFQHLAGIMHKKRFKKKEVILKEGQVCKYYYFITRGSIRSFSQDSGKEVNIKFYFEDDIACDFISYRLEEPSHFYMVAMEDCTVYYAAKTESAPIFENTISLHMTLFRFFQDLYFREEDHSNSFKLLSPEERYKYLVENKPQYLQRITFTQLASYLGISRETLNRIRKKIN
jgi:CRP-like cAMP-binding protein